MGKINAPFGELLPDVEGNKYIGHSIDFSVLENLGVFVLKNAIKLNAVKNYYENYLAEIHSGSIKKTDYHLTEVKFEKNSALSRITEDIDFLGVVSKFFNGNVGSDFIRIVKKDAENYAPVFLHQDTAYQIGGMERYSLFLAITDCNKNNGGLILYPGTRKFGYLGDAGEIKNILPEDYPRIESDLSPGDILIMHSSTWHESPENISREDRVYLEVHIQQIDEPATRFEICGHRQSKWVLTLKEDEIFTNSRAQRIRRLYKEIETLKSREV